MKKLVVLSGAGVSAESGLQTFRDSDGLWMGYNVYEVATPEGWKSDRKKVQDFYNMRRREVKMAQPNEAHKAIASLQCKYDVQVITQNIDDLHERAGSKKVLHLHGSIFKMKSDRDDTNTYEILEDISPDAKAADGGYLRPDVVWFGEPVLLIETASRISSTAEIFIVVGTSLQVYPAAGLVSVLPEFIPKFLVDKKPPGTFIAENFTVITKPATEGMKDVLKLLM